MSLTASESAGHTSRYRRIHTPGLFRPRQQAFWVYAALILAGTWFTVVQQDVLERISPSGFALSWLLLALYLIPAVVLISFLDLARVQPRSLLLGALLWGAVTATSVAGLGNDGWGLVVARLAGPEVAAQWSAALTAPVVEESAKVLGVILLAMIARDQFRDPLDGFVFGALVGLGFSVVEDVLYFVGIYGGTPSDVLHGFFIRAIGSGLYGHVLWTGISGLGVAYAVAHSDRQPRARRFVVAGSLLLVAMAGHFLWDSPLLDLYPTTTNLWLVFAALSVKGLPFLAFGATLILLARRRERGALRVALKSEAIQGSIPQEEISVLASPALRRRARRAERSHGGRRGARTLGRLQREQLRLAAMLQRYGLDAPVTQRKRAICERLRRDLHTGQGSTTAIV
jgi:RsiW-degrading membrane proteinase PrsW (M82 family)